MGIAFAGELLVLKVDPAFSVFGGLYFYTSVVIAGLVIQGFAPDFQIPRRSIMLLGSIPAFASSAMATYLKVAGSAWLPVGYTTFRPQR